MCSLPVKLVIIVTIRINIKPFQQPDSAKLPGILIDKPVLA